MFYSRVLCVVLLTILSSTVPVKAQSTTTVQTTTTTIQSTTEDPSTTTTREDRFARMRQRLSFIRHQVLQVLGWNEFPVIENKIDLLNRLRSDITSYNMSSQKCYVSSCDLPRATTADLWYDDRSRTMRMYFDIITPRSNENVNVLGATLKLYIKDQACCYDDTCTTERPQVFIKVYQFIKPLRRRRGKRVPRKKVIVTEDVQCRSRTWITLNITSAAKDWMRRPRKNFGLEIKVLDEYESRLNAKTIFSGECRTVPDIDCNTQEITVNGVSSVTAPVLEVNQTQTPNIFRNRQRRDVVDKDSDGSQKEDYYITTTISEKE